MPTPDVPMLDMVQQALANIRCAEEHLGRAAGTQSLLRIHEQVGYAGEQLSVAKTLLRTAVAGPNT